MVTPKLTKTLVKILVNYDIRQVMKRELDHKNFGFHCESHWRAMSSFKQRSNVISLHLKESLWLLR